MSDMKTVENDGNVEEFLDSVENERRRTDARRVAAMMEEITGEAPRMWGDSIVGFGRYVYRRSDGTRHRWMLTGVSPRKAALTVYIMPGFGAYGDIMKRLGKFRHSVSCLYVTRLENIDFAALSELVRQSVDEMRRRYAES